MNDPTNDIDALQAQLMKAREDEGWFITGDQAKDFSRALTALVEERDEYKARCKAQHEVMANMVGKQREAASDLRERLVCAIWPVIIQQWREYKDAIDPRGDARSDALFEADKMLAAMRKGEE